MIEAQCDPEGAEQRANPEGECPTCRRLVSDFRMLEQFVGELAEDIWELQQLHKVKPRPRIWNLRYWKNNG